MNYKKREVDLLKSLVDLPQKNLEKLIIKLENLKKNRKTIHDDLQLEISNIQNQLMTWCDLNRYFPDKQINLNQQLWQLTNIRHNERLNCFHDILALEEKLSKKQEELELNRMKQHFIK